MQHVFRRQLDCETVVAAGLLLRRRGSKRCMREWAPLLRRGYSVPAIKKGDQIEVTRNVQYLRSSRGIGLSGVQRRWNSSVSSHESDLPPRTWSTPLAKTLAAAIEATGPISIASYMRQCLTNPDGGYYTKPNTTEGDPFGRRGDFITSPEISQVFGELVGVWFLTEWIGQGRMDRGVQFIELGPGRGTLMNDILRTAAQFKAFTTAIEAVWLVEAGEGLRKTQKDLLCGQDVEMVEKKNEKEKYTWWEATSKYAGIPIRWVEDVALLPQQRVGEKTPFIVAHEFFDALPIHAFESVAPRDGVDDGKTTLLNSEGEPMVRKNSGSKIPQWRELLVSPTRRKLMLMEDAQQSRQNESDPDFQLTLAKASTPTSLVLPERSRYHHLKSQPGSRIEVSPESVRYIQDIAKRIGAAQLGKAAGAALIIDYGPLDTIPINSLRGIRKHKVISPFAYPGEADISADVDFGSLADSALEASPDVEVHGPVEQGMWLNQLGIQERAQRLLKSMQGDNLEDRRKEMESGWKRLVEGGPRGMGKAYKVMAILPENGGKRRPVGFGGNVVG